MWGLDKWAYLQSAMGLCVAACLTENKGLGMPAIVSPEELKAAQKDLIEAKDLDEL